MRKISVRAKAGSRCACPRSPRHAGARAGRSAAVLGRGNVQTATRIGESGDGLLCHVAATGDGRTPGGFRRDAENGKRDGRAPQQSSSRAAKISLLWTNGTKRITCPVQNPHRLKHWLFKNYAIISVTAFLGTLLFFAVLQINCHTFNWQALVVIVGGIISFTFTVQKQQLEEVHLFRDLFKEFNERYDKQNEVLNRIHQQPADQPLTTEERDALFEYFNLCGEEFLYYKQGFIYQEVWESWYNGMKFFQDNNRIKDLWDKESKKNASYYGLTF